MYDANALHPNAPISCTTANLPWNQSEVLMSGVEVVCRSRWRS